MYCLINVLTISTHSLYIAKFIRIFLFHFKRGGRFQLQSKSTLCRWISVRTGAERNWTLTHVAKSSFVMDRLPSHLCDLMCFRLVATKSGCARAESQNKRCQTEVWQCGGCREAAHRALSVLSKVTARKRYLSTKCQQVDLKCTHFRWKLARCHGSLDNIVQCFVSLYLERNRLQSNHWSEYQRGELLWKSSGVRAKMTACPLHLCSRCRLRTTRTQPPTFSSTTSSDRTSAADGSIVQLSLALFVRIPAAVPTVFHLLPRPPSRLQPTEGIPRPTEGKQRNLGSSRRHPLL